MNVFEADVVVSAEVAGKTYDLAEFVVDSDDDHCLEGERYAYNLITSPPRRLGQRLAIAEAIKSELDL